MWLTIHVGGIRPYRGAIPKVLYYRAFQLFVVVINNNETFVLFDRTILI